MLSSAHVREKDFLLLLFSFCCEGTEAGRCMVIAGRVKKPGVYRFLDMCGFLPELSEAVENFQQYAEPTFKHLWTKSHYLWRHGSAKR